MYVYERACRFHGSVRMCVCVRARRCGLAVCTNVRLYRCLCLEACTDALMRTPTRIRGPICVRLQPIASCVRVRLDIYACVCRWLVMDRCASVCIYMYMYIHSDIYIPIIYLLCTYMYARLHVCVDTLCTQASICVCTGTDAARIDGCTCIQSPSIHLNI